jgi:hypothetical protein
VTRAEARLQLDKIIDRELDIDGQENELYTIQDYKGTLTLIWNSPLIPNTELEYEDVF